MGRFASIVALVLSLTTSAWAVPSVGHTFPSFTVNDLNGSARSQQDLTGRYRVVFAMSDKDTGPAVTSWYQRVRQGAPEAQLITMAALELFPLIPTATLISQARDSTPRGRWGEVWLSRDGSLATSLGLPESETPWVFVVDPSGRVVEAVHAAVDDAGLARILAALRPRTTPAPAAP